MDGNVFTIAAKELKRFKEKDLLEWACEYIQLTVGGMVRPFSLEGHEYLRELYTMPDVQREVYQKAGQMAISTYALIKTLYRADRQAIKVVYYFPTDEDVRDFAQDRANVMIDNSTYLSQKMVYDKADNLGLKQIGASSIYFRGVFSKRKVKSIDADMIVKDEVDEADQENLIFAEDRLLHSPFKWIIELSQPSRPDFGINRSFKKSDQRYLMVKCKGCGRWNNIVDSFPKNLFSKGKGDTVQAWIGCTRCKKRLDVHHGQWVATYSDRKDCRGYLVSQLFSSTVDATFIYKKFTGAVLTSEKKNVWNSIVGIPYHDPQMCPVTDAVLDACTGTDGFVHKAYSSFIGIDVGDICHVVVLGWAKNRLQVLWLEEVLATNKERFEQIIEAYNGFFVIDAMPYKPLAKYLCKKYYGWGAMQYFNAQELITKNEHDGDVDIPVVKHDRTTSIEDMVSLLQEGFFIIPNPKKLHAHELEVFEKFKFQLKNLEKEKVVDAKGYEKVEYKKNVANHFGMALNSAFIAFQVGRGNFTPRVEPVFG